MVFVKLRETYDLHTIQNKLSIIAIHTPKADLVKAQYPGLLMQCKAWRPVSCDVKVACASVMPLDPLGVGTSEGDIAPEDIFNPILYKATSNLGMSQIEARIRRIADGDISGATLRGSSAIVDNQNVDTYADDFKVYYGLLANPHEFKHANPQSGLSMSGLRPFVFEMLYNVGSDDTAPNSSGSGAVSIAGASFRGGSKPLPLLPTLKYSDGHEAAGFPQPTDEGSPGYPANHMVDMICPHVICGMIIVPPSRLHQLFYRMVVEWTLEFTAVRPLSEIVSWTGLGQIADLTHFQSYDYSVAKKVITGDEETVLNSDVNMASANVDIKKVM